MPEQKKGVPPHRTFVAVLEYSRNVLTHLLFITLVTFTIWLVVAEVLSSDIFIAPIEIPKSLKDAGMTEGGVARELREQIGYIRSAASGGGRQHSGRYNFESAHRRVTASDESRSAYRSFSDLPDIVIPQANLSLASVVAYLRAASGLSRAGISGAIEEKDDFGTYSFHIILNGEPLAPVERAGPVTAAGLIRAEALAVEAKYEPDFAALFLSDREPVAAIAILKTLIGNSGTAPELRAWSFNLWGNILRSQGRYRDAINRYQLALQVAPDGAPIRAITHAELGVLYLLAKDNRSAEAEFQAAVDQRPLAKYYTDLGIAQAAQDTDAKRADAEKNFQAALAQDATFAPAYASAGNLYARQHRWDEAIDSYRKAIGHKPGFGAAYFNLALVESRRGESEAALSDFQNALEFDPAPSGAMLDQLEDALNRYLDGKTIADAKRNRVIGLCVRLLSSALPNGWSPSPFFDRLAVRLHDGRCARPLKG